MIVSTAFTDDSAKVAWCQHDVYGQALGIIVSRCQRKMRLAAALLNMPAPPGANSSLAFDHRLLQRAHDILAAAWRFRSNAAQTSLAFGDDDAPDVSWLRWLEQELDTWEESPSLIRLTLSVISETESQKLALNADRLALALFGRFAGVPWVNGYAQEYEALKKAEERGEF